MWVFVWVAFPICSVCETVLNVLVILHWVQKKYLGFSRAVLCGPLFVQGPSVLGNISQSPDRLSVCNGTCQSVLPYHLPSILCVRAEVDVFSFYSSIRLLRAEHAAWKSSSECGVRNEGQRNTLPFPNPGFTETQHLPLMRKRPAKPVMFLSFPDLSFVQSN